MTQEHSALSNTIIPENFGKWLQEEREKKNISLELLSQKTKIPLTLLKTLENNNFEELPALVFIKGHLKSLCVLLDIDFNKAMFFLEKELEKSGKSVSLAHNNFEGPLSPENEVSKTVGLSKTFSFSLFSSSSNTKRLLLFSIFFFSSVLIVGIGYYVLFVTKKENVVITKHHVMASQAQPQQERQQQIVQENQENQKNVEKEDYKTHDDGQVNQEEQKLVLWAKGEDCWIAYALNQEQPKQLILRKGNKVVLNALDIRLMIGNLQAMDISYQGSPFVFPKSVSVKSFIFPPHNPKGHIPPFFEFNSTGEIQFSTKGPVQAPKEEENKRKEEKAP